MVDEILALCPVNRVVLGADRGLLSLAVPGRRHSEFSEILGTLHAEHCESARHEVIGETSWQGLRLIWAHDPQAAAQQGAARDRRGAHAASPAARRQARRPGRRSHL